MTGLDKPLGIQEVKVHRISRQPAYDGGKVVSPTYRPPLPLRRFLWYSFMFEAEG